MIHSRERERISQVLDRHRSFWRGKNTSPLRAVLQHPAWRKKPYPLASGEYATAPRRLRPSDIDIDLLLGASDIPDSPLIDEYIRGVKPVYSVAFMESIIGCPVYASETSCYSRPVDTVEDAAGREGWQPVLDEIVRREVDLGAEALPALQLHLRGVVDMVAAYYGEERMSLLFFDGPGRVHETVDEFVSVFCEMAETGVSLRPDWNGGMVSHWGVFAPGRLLDYQIDATSILSPAQYEEFFRQADESIFETYQYVVLHLHACGLHMIDSLPTADSAAVCAAGIALDRETGVWQPARIAASAENLQQQGYRVILTGELDTDEVAWFEARLDPNGLAIFNWLPDPNYRPT